MNTSATSTSSAREVRVERPDPHYALITLDNPPRNQLSFAGRTALVEALAELDTDHDIRCLVVTGTGSGFTAGNDLRQDVAMGDGDVDDFLGGFGRVLLGLERFRAPVIAAINGATAGGGLEFALCCDVRIASSEAVFIAAGVNVGLIANFYRLPRVVGEGPAKDLLLTGRRWSAEEALRWGLVTAVHPPDQLLDAAHALANRIASRAPLSVEATKDAVHRVRHATADEAQALQAEHFARLFRTDDHAEAVAAFFEKRSPTFHRR
ncbi:MAG: enoyl-CoA hydratase/isomerase family protein [Acidimicrobiales bacterium]